MEAWLLDQSPGHYRWGEVALPEPEPGQVVVEVVASALNHMDLWLRQGKPAPRQLPMVPGCDGAGRVSDLGPGVKRWAVGDEVVINPSFACGRCHECTAGRSVFCPQWGIMGEHYWGAHGQYVLVGERNLVAKPASLGWEEAAAYGLCGLTAYRMLRRARVGPEDTVVVTGAGGGVATAAIALAHHLGAAVLATSRDPAKCERAKALGASEVFVVDASGSGGEHLAGRADVVVDSTGSPTWRLAFSALRPGGRLVLCGATGGGKVELSVPKLFFGQFEVIGSTMGTFEEFDALTDAVASGLAVAVDSTYALVDYPSALERMDSGHQFGKISLRH